MHGKTWKSAYFDAPWATHRRRWLLLLARTGSLGLWHVEVRRGSIQCDLFWSARSLCRARSLRQALQAELRAEALRTMEAFHGLESWLKELYRAAKLESAEGVVSQGQQSTIVSQLNSETEHLKRDTERIKRSPSTRLSTSASSSQQTRRVCLAQARHASKIAVGEHRALRQSTVRRTFQIFY